MQFLGIKISDVSKEQALQKVAEFLGGGLPGGALAKSGQHMIFTPNPEMVVKAQKDEYFKKVLNTGDLNLCDGRGLELAVRFFARPDCHPERDPKGDEGSLSGKVLDRDSSPLRRGFGMTKKIKRITGIDFMVEICKLAAEQGRSVYLLGSGNDEVVKKTAEELLKKYPNLKIAGYDKGQVISENIQYPISNIQSINNSNAEILFVAFGMGKQEKWIHENLAKMPSVKIAMGVGGSFDYISGKVKRAPLFLRRLGLEWIYRLIQEPRRFGRIFNATVKFTWLALTKKYD